MIFLHKDDPVLAEAIKREKSRIDNTIDLIAAENHSPLSIMEALGSVFNTKTIEGYPGKRFHAGCIHADEVENLAIRRCKKLFGAEYINVQPHSGTSANLAVYFSVLELGDRILSMSLPHGVHLSHGHRASITSKCFEFNYYGLDEDTERIDYEKIRDLAHKFKPRMIVAGASSYPRLIDYEKMSEIASEVSAYLFTDMAHIAGLVAAKVIPSPVPYSDFVTFTGYKTMMGGRGGIIICRQEYGKKIDKAIFPGCQGTSAVNSIVAKALNFKLAMAPEFIDIQMKTLENAVCLADQLGYRIVTGGTDNHQVLVDLAPKGLDGYRAEKLLESVGIITNRNVIPRDSENPGNISGIRLGSSAAATRGMGISEMVNIAGWIDDVLVNHDKKDVLDRVSKEVLGLCEQFPVYDSKQF